MKETETYQFNIGRQESLIEKDFMVRAISALSYDSGKSFIYNPECITGASYLKSYFDPMPAFRTYTEDMIVYIVDDLTREVTFI